MDLVTVKLPPGMTFTDGTDVVSDIEADPVSAEYQDPEEDGASQPEPGAAPLPGAETED